MSRVGSMPIPVPDGVEVRLEKDALTAKGKAGQRRYTLPREVEVSSADGTIVVTPRGDSKRGSADLGGRPVPISPASSRECIPPLSAS